MPKLLMIAAALVNFGDDAGAVAKEQSDIIDVTKQTAEKLVVAERALYVSKADDPTKTKQFTASEEMLKAAETVRKMRGKVDKKD